MHFCASFFTQLIDNKSELSVFQSSKLFLHKSTSSHESSLEALLERALFNKIVWEAKIVHNYLFNEFSTVLIMFTV